jgi:hypothetical protein
MVCRNCGTQIADKALICYRCGEATTEPTVKPPATPVNGGIWPTALIALFLTVLALGYQPLVQGQAPDPWVYAVVAAGGGGLAWRLLQRRR